MKQKTEFRKYKWLTILNSTRCDFKLSRGKERRLYKIMKKVKELSEEMESLFKHETKN